jgi:methylene-tetrahydromethanopterin dehydrogenase
MAKRSILHMLDPMPNNSPFDINMALDAGFDVLIPYNNVKLDSVYGLTQDATFSRSPSGVKQTGIFIGGRDLGLAMDMLNTSKQAMVSPFEVSVFADPSGAFTTAAALVTCAEKVLKEKHGKDLKGCTIAIFGGTGPVGIATGIISSLAGADVTITDHLSVDTALDVAKAYNRRFNCNLKAALANTDADKIQIIADLDVVFCTAKAGIQVLNANVLKHAEHLKVAADVNAVPPYGIEGVKNDDFGKPLIHATNAQGAVGIGSLAIGDVKFQLQHELLKSMLETEAPLFIDFRYAFTKAREMQFGSGAN